MMIDIRPKNDCVELRMSNEQAIMLYRLFDCMSGGHGKKIALDDDFTNGEYRDRIRPEFADPFTEMMEEHHAYLLLGEEECCFVHKTK